VVVDETKVAVEDRDVYVWAAVDRHTFEVIHVEASPGRSDLDALLFLRTFLERCRGGPVLIVDRGPWYNWSLDDLDLPCEVRRETWGDRSLVNPGSRSSKSPLTDSSTASRITAPGSRSIGGPTPSPSNARR